MNFVHPLGVQISSFVFKYLSWKHKVLKETERGVNKSILPHRYCHLRHDD
jgi:hypothetical protein